MVVGAGGAGLRWFPARTGRGCGVVGFVVSVGGGDDHFEGVAVAPEVRGGGGVDAGPPEGAFVVCDRGRLRAVGEGRV